MECRECKKPLNDDTVFYDIFSARYCAECYIRLMPPYPGPNIDPQLIRAENSLKTERL